MCVLEMIVLSSIFFLFAYTINAINTQKTQKKTDDININKFTTTPAAINPQIPYLYSSAS